MSDARLKDIRMRPGIDKNDTEYGAEGGWIDCDKVRSRGDKIEKIGGWVRESTAQNTDNSIDTFTGVARDIHSWIDLNFKKYLAVATHKKIELLTDNLIYDVTPYREELTLTDAISTTSASASVQITDVGHNLAVGDYVFVDSQASAVDGITLSGEYTVTTVIDSDNYTVTAATAASGTTALAGGDLDINYMLENGPQDNGNLTGYSGGTYNTEGSGGGGYNRPRSGVGGLFCRQWSLDNWGEDLIACMRDGQIYQWDATNGVTERMEVITDAPTQNLFCLITQPSRFLVAFGTQQSVGGVFDPLNIRWAEQETLTEWTITSTNTAGEYRLPKGNYIVAAVQTKQEIIIFTDSVVYSMQYIGDENVFRFTPIGDNVGTISQHSAVDIDGAVFWVGKNALNFYNGVIKTLPTSINKYLFDQDGEGRINRGQEEKVYVSTNKEFNEIIVLYPDYTSTEINRYFIYNYIDNLYYIGSIDRTVWEDASIFNKPYSINEAGDLYVHETGHDDDATPMYSWIKSAYFDIEDGQELMFVDKVVPDIRMPANKPLDITIFTKKYPNSTEIIKGPYTVDGNTTKVNVRARGRQMAILYESNANGAFYQLGKMRLAIQPDGGS